MCMSPKAPSPPPPPPPPPEPPVKVQDVTAERKQSAPIDAESEAKGRARVTEKKRVGRSSLRIPLASSGLSSSGVNFPTS